MTHKENDIAKELREIAPELEHLRVHPHFDVPAKYFDAFPAQLLTHIKAMENSSAVTEELEHLSPLLAGVSRETPFSVPEDYFKGLTELVVKEKNFAQEGRVVKMGRRIRLFKQCLAAASIAGLIAVSAVLISRSLSGTSMDRMMARISDQEIEEYLTYHTDAFDNENIFTNVSLEGEMPSVLPEDLSTKEIDNLLENNLLQDDLVN
ncbi:hypothetical protein DLD77_09430 [Chitinophaga alhagiae]|uniref:Uncharacterized protein n=1 Tax=Chitinophaga alhagiae TaxID=2203219 RepID=A0ABM6WDC6_9BACT|nr:hypothetical protein [Chitinophaga alhagiae]AWO01902.1 hypothetical protein DLD77_09430 [Chitinophaga alhagiae]